MNMFEVLFCQAQTLILSPFMQIYLTWGLSDWALSSGCHPLFSLILLYCMYRNTDHWKLLLVRIKLPITRGFSLEIHVIGTEKRAQRRYDIWKGDFKCGEIKTGFFRNRSMQTGSPGTLIGLKFGQTTYLPLWDRMEGAWLWTQVMFNIWTTGAMDRISGQPQVKLSLLRSISLQIWPLAIFTKQY